MHTLDGSKTGLAQARSVSIMVRLEFWIALTGRVGATMREFDVIRLDISTSFSKNSPIWWLRVRVGVRSRDQQSVVHRISSEIIEV